jgi:hypothetical protein
MLKELNPHYGPYLVLSDSDMIDRAKIAKEISKLSDIREKLYSKIGEKVLDKNKDEQEELLNQQEIKENKLIKEGKAKENALIIESYLFRFIYFIYVIIVFIINKLFELLKLIMQAIAYFIDKLLHIFDKADENVKYILTGIFKIVRFILDKGLKFAIPIFIFIIFIYIIVLVICKVFKLDCTLIEFKMPKTYKAEFADNLLKRIEYERDNFTFTDIYNEFSITNPLTSISTIIKRVGNYTIQAPIEYTRRNFTKAVDSVQQSLGISSEPEYTDTYDRELIQENRSNDINNIKTDYISDKKILSAKDIPIVKASVDIAIPKNIDWQMNNNEYVNRNYDYSKLPKSILESKNENDLSLEDKTNITIPYKIVNNTYQLSCNDSYFTNNVSEKTNMLKDNSDNLHCDINKDAKVEIYDTDKKRQKTANDLSVYN